MREVKVGDIVRVCARSGADLGSDKHVRQHDGMLMTVVHAKRRTIYVRHLDGAPVLVEGGRPVNATGKLHLLNDEFEVVT